MTKDELLDRIESNAHTLGKLGKHYYKYHYTRGFVHWMTRFKAEKYSKIHEEQEGLLEELKRV